MKNVFNKKISSLIKPKREKTALLFVTFVLLFSLFSLIGCNHESGDSKVTNNKPGDIDLSLPIIEDTIIPSLPPLSPSKENDEKDIFETTISNTKEAKATANTKRTENIVGGLDEAPSAWEGIMKHPFEGGIKVVNFVNGAVTLEMSKDQIKKNLSSAGLSLNDTCFFSSADATEWKNLFREGCEPPGGVKDTLLEMIEEDEIDSVYELFSNAESINEFGEKIKSSGSKIKLTIDLPANKIPADPLDFKTFDIWYAPHINALTNLCIPIPGDSWWNSSCTSSCWNISCSFFPTQFCSNIYTHDIQQGHDVGTWLYPQGCHYKGDKYTEF